ncbi:MAG TPA: aminodeoxychorismate synthase component I [Gemmataceae bacterium]
MKMEGGACLAEQTAGPGAPVTPLAEELTSWLDPWEAARRLAHLPHLLLLESVFSHPTLGRYSFVTAEPFDWLRARERSRDREGAEGVSAPSRSRLEQANPFVMLQERLRPWRVETIPGLPPFQGGAAGLFGYDLCHHIERLPRPRFDEFETPDLAVGFYDWVIAFDHAQRRAWIISAGLPEAEPDRRRRRALLRLETVKRRLISPIGNREQGTGNRKEAAVPCSLFPVPCLRGVFSNFNRPGYLAAARRAIEYVHAGDCFQVNLSQRLLHAATLAPLELYGRLRERNPAPFAGYFDLGDFVVVSASPERFLRVEDGRVETRPIKGTRPRGATPAEDRQQRDELLRSAKDRAENVMIIDLLRNDLGRVCAYGSVRVPAVCRLESYRTVHHLVSEVVGRLRPGLGPIDLLRAAFPGGSVTGAPKVRAMQIIAELESTARGPYCGSLGYIGFDGSMDTNILIRTFTVGRGWMQFPVGGGIVADSTPEAEYEETLHKAEGLLRALR